MSIYINKLSSKNPLDVALAYDYFTSVGLLSLEPQVRYKLLPILKSSMDNRAKTLLQTLQPIVSTTIPYIPPTVSESKSEEKHEITIENTIEPTSIAYRLTCRQLLAEQLETQTTKYKAENLAGEIETAVWNAYQKETIEEQYKEITKECQSTPVTEMSKEQLTLRKESDVKRFTVACFKETINNKMCDLLSYLSCDLLKAYKNQMRNIILHAKEKAFCSYLVQGLVSPKKVSTMSPYEMVSTEILTQQQKIKQQQAAECMAEKQSIGTTMFTCGKCKQKNCTYYQLQTRSADEPMTTFVTCCSCGNKWKF